MLTSKQRAALRAKANGLAPVVLIGKGGISPNLLESISENLECRELVKISVLNNCDFSAKDLVNDLALRLGAEPVSAVGSKMVLYRRSKKEGVEHIEF